MKRNRLIVLMSPALPRCMGPWRAPRSRTTTTWTPAAWPRSTGFRRPDRTGALQARPRRPARCPWATSPAVSVPSGGSTAAPPRARWSWSPRRWWPGANRSPMTASAASPASGLAADPRAVAPPWCRLPTGTRERPCPSEAHAPGQGLRPGRSAGSAGWRGPSHAGPRRPRRRRPPRPPGWQ